MNKRAWFLAGLLISGVYAGTASAELIIGAKLGAVNYEDNFNTDYDPGINGSVQLGYEFADLVFADLAFEGELSTSIVDAEDGNGILSDSSFDSLGAYISLRTIGPVYAIARVGYAKTEISSAFGSVEDEGVSKGIGIGFSAGVRFEIEYTTYEVENIDIDYITLGLSF